MNSSGDGSFKAVPSRNTWPASCTPTMPLERNISTHHTAACCWITSCCSANHETHLQQLQVPPLLLLAFVGALLHLKLPCKRFSCLNTALCPHTAALVQGPVADRR